MQKTCRTCDGFGDESEFVNGENQCLRCRRVYDKGPKGKAWNHSPAGKAANKARLAALRGLIRVFDPAPRTQSLWLNITVYRSRKIAEAAHKAGDLSYKPIDPSTVPPEWYFVRDCQGAGEFCIIRNKGKRLALDHRHEDGCGRGMLCSWCNFDMGLVDAGKKPWELGPWRFRPDLKMPGKIYMPLEVEIIDPYAKLFTPRKVG